MKKLMAKKKFFDGGLNGHQYLGQEGVELPNLGHKEMRVNVFFRIFI